MLGAGRAFGVINPVMVRYVFGPELFTKMYSDLYAVFLLGTAATATLFGAVYNMSGSYNGVYLLVLVCSATEMIVGRLIFRNITKEGSNK